MAALRGDISFRYLKQFFLVDKFSKLNELFCNYKETVYVLVTNHKSKTAATENRNFFNCPLLL